MYLAEFTVNASVAVEVRQLASLLLKQYVEVHWSQHSDKFRQPETTERVTNLSVFYQLHLISTVCSTWQYIDQWHYGLRKYEVRKLLCFFDRKLQISNEVLQEFTFCPYISPK